MASKRRWATSGLIFLIAFLPRAVYPVSRAMQWFSRSVRFGDALLAHDWAATYQRYHPGVTTMWLSGIGLKVFGWYRGLSSDELVGIAPTQPGTLNDAVTAGVLPLALVIALCIAASYSLVGRVLGAKVGLVAGCLLALDPFHITYSKVLHVDALLATFMMMSVLLLLAYVHQGARIHLLLSGAFGGLSCLSKSPAVFLIPYAVLLVVTYTLVPALAGSGTLAVSGRWPRRLRWCLEALAVWAGALALTFVALWPAMWVEPVHVLSQVMERVIFHVGTAHRNPVFFNGRTTLEDPGLLFYLATIAWKTTLVTLPASGLGAVLSVRRNGRARATTAVWMLAAYVVFFTVQMGLSARKELPYLLPVFPGLSVLAAYGLVRLADLIEGRDGPRKVSRLSGAFLGLALVLQFATVSRHHPYYGTHHNLLFGGSRVAQRVLPLQDQGEGLDLAGRYLNTLPRAQRASAVLHQRNMATFRREFVGLTSAVYDPRANYRVYYVNQVTRGLGGDEWEQSWLRDRQTMPIWSVAFDGVTYVWVYGTPPPEPAAGGPEYVVHYRLGEHIVLQRARLSDEAVRAGEGLTVALMWISDGSVTDSYKVFCHVLSPDGDLAGQKDGFPLSGVRPTPSWRADEVIEDSYDIVVDASAPSGDYQVSVGMYDPDTFDRVPVYDASGSRLLDDRMVVGWLTVTTAPH